jgi:hypothetical protein
MSIAPRRASRRDVTTSRREATRERPLGQARLAP